MCVLRVEARGQAGVLITITTTPDVSTLAPGRAHTVGTIAEAVSLVAGFLHAYQYGDISDPAPLDGDSDRGQCDG